MPSERKQKCWELVMIIFAITTSVGDSGTIQGYFLGWN